MHSVPEGQPSGAIHATSQTGVGLMGHAHASFFNLGDKINKKVLEYELKILELECTKLYNTGIIYVEEYTEAIEDILFLK